MRRMHGLQRRSCSTTGQARPLPFSESQENQSEQHNDTMVRSKCSNSIGSIRLRHTFTHVKASDTRGSILREMAFCANTGRPTEDVVAARKANKKSVKEANNLKRMVISANIAEFSSIKRGYIAHFSTFSMETSAIFAEVPPHAA